MKRRHFLAAGTALTAGAGLGGCSALRTKTAVKPETTPFEPDKRLPKPSGAMPMGEVGKTGIRVSRFGFGSHMTREVAKYTKEREWMIREAFDLGVNLFDVYDYEFQIYQYEPTGRYLRDVIGDAVISITTWPFEGRTVEQQMERDLRLFNRDYIDLVRIHAWKNTQDEKELAAQVGHRWEWWETLFRMKEKGYVRAVGVPIHEQADIVEPLTQLPLDFVIVPYNFYHNWSFAGKKQTEWDRTIADIRKRGIGVISMKPFAGDHLVTPFKRLASEYDDSGELNFAKACLRYVINSGKDFDSTLGGMYSPYHVYENVDAYFNPAMSATERKLLDRIAGTAQVVARDLLPPHYRFLDEWAPPAVV